MRREERHHLKQNPLAIVLTEAQGWIAESGRPILIGGGIVLAALIVAGAYFSWTQMQERRAGELFAEAMFTLEAAVVPPPEDPIVTLPESDVPDVDDATADEPAAGGTGDTNDTNDVTTDAAGELPAPPAEFVQPPGSFSSLEAKLKTALPQLLTAADAYPSTQQGLTARYQAAAVLIALERATEAAVQYRQVMDLAGDALYGQMSRMGLAEALLLTGQPQEAIPLLEGQTSSLESLIPVDAVLMRLGHAYQLAGQPDDALAAFNRVVEEFPISMYFTDAQQQVETLRQGDGAPSSSD